MVSKQTMVDLLGMVEKWRQESDSAEELGLPECADMAARHADELDAALDKLMENRDER